jgi:hypothetical protein
MKRDGYQAPTGDEKPATPTTGSGVIRAHQFDDRCTIVAYIAVSPRGNPIRSTIRPTPDEAWQELRRSISEPDELIDRWQIHRVEVTMMERVE